MAWQYVGHIAPLYRHYREYKDNQRMASLYPDNDEYKARVIVLSDIMDIEAYNLAKEWAKPDEDINSYITHFRSICYRLYRNNVTYQRGCAMYLAHYRDGDKWMYRDGTTKKIIESMYIPPECGMPLLRDRPSNLCDSW